MDKLNPPSKLLLIEKKTYATFAHLDAVYGYAHPLNEPLNFETTLVKAYSLDLSPKPQETLYGMMLKLNVSKLLHMLNSTKA